MNGLDLPLRRCKRNRSLVGHPSRADQDDSEQTSRFLRCPTPDPRPRRGCPRQLPRGRLSGQTTCILEIAKGAGSPLRGHGAAHGGACPPVYFGQPRTLTLSEPLRPEAPSQGQRSGLRSAAAGARARIGGVDLRQLAARARADSSGQLPGRACGPGRTLATTQPCDHGDDSAAGARSDTPSCWHQSTHQSAIQSAQAGQDSDRVSGTQTHREWNASATMPEPWTLPSLSGQM